LFLSDGSYGSQRPSNQQYPPQNYASHDYNYNHGESDYYPRDDGYGGYSRPPPQRSNTNGNGHTTVIVQPSNPVVVSDGSNSGYYPGASSSGKYSGTDLALGMLAGAAIGGGLGKNTKNIKPSKFQNEINSMFDV
jgi:hypothetical protein